MTEPSANHQTEDLQDTGADGDLGDQAGGHGAASEVKPPRGMEAERTKAQDMKKSPKLQAAAAAAANATDAAVKAARAAVLAAREAEERQKEFEALSRGELSQNSRTNGPENSDNHMGMHGNAALEGAEATGFFSAMETASMAVTEADILHKRVEAAKQALSLQTASNDASTKGELMRRSERRSEAVDAKATHANGPQQGFEGEKTLGDSADTGATLAEETHGNAKHDREVIGEASVPSTMVLRI